jgi:signal transduction histidine kinase
MRPGAGGRPGRSRPDARSPSTTSDDVGTEPAKRQTRVATALLAATSRLAGLATLHELLQALSVAARDVTGAEYAGVARRTPDGEGFELVFVDGLAPEMEAMLRAEPLRAPRYPFVADVLGRDADQSVRRPDRPWALGSSHLAVAPIRIDDEVWGMVGLGVAATDPQPTDDWQALAEGLAAIGAAAIARAMATEELDIQRRRSDTLLALSSALGEVNDRDEIERMVCAFIRTASRAEFAMVGRRDPETDRFVVAATAGLDAGQVARIEAALRASDRPSLRELLAGGVPTRTGEAAVGQGMGIAAAMGAPIVIGGRTDGFLAIGAPTGALVRPADWHELLIAFAALTASAIIRTDAVGALARQRDVLASEVEERTRSLRTAIDELRLASDAKTDFLANVSHELRTPLTSILGFAEILSAGLDGPLTDDQARDIETVRSNSRHLLELIDDLIDIASIESGRIQLLIGPVLVDDVMRDAAEAIRPLAEAKGVALEVGGPDGGAVGGSTVVAADRGRLREIVLNLLSNAVKFTPAGGRVDVWSALEPTSVDGSGAGPWPGPMVTIAVRDTGTGVALGDQERIFEKFVRIAPAATPGTGLGLPISRELARLHGGDLTVASTPNRGSTFTVRIPQAGLP